MSSGINHQVGIQASPEETVAGAAAGSTTEREPNIPKIVSRDEWLIARKQLLAREKEFDHERDRLTEARRNLPMVLVDKEYVFAGRQGAVTLRDLFEGRRQLIVYHVMFDPDRDTACKHCSCVMDNIAGSLVHLNARDTSFAAISRAPVAKIEAFKSRMHWTFPWLSSFANDFNYDYHVTLDPDRGSTVYNYKTFDYRGELPGMSVFFRDDNDLIFHSYSTYFRGLDMLLPMYHLLDRTPLGRNEDQGISMADGEASWTRYHDSYGAEGSGACCRELHGKLRRNSGNEKGFSPRRFDCGNNLAIQKRIASSPVKRRKNAQPLRDLRQHVCGTSVLGANPGDNGWNFKEFRKLRKCQDANPQTIKRVSLREFHDACLKIGEENHSFLRIDP
jgi:predicted dithiol-disulfide oxidoreductase (DUF899 family)